MHVMGARLTEFAHVYPAGPRLGSQERNCKGVIDMRCACQADLGLHTSCSCMCKALFVD
jgi:hypothetical protein